MGDYPIHVLIFPVIGLAVVVYMVFFRKRLWAKQEQQYANYRAGELAQRLGLTLVEGDPTFNLFIQHAYVDIQRGPKDGRPIHIQIRAQGAPQGTPIELFYLYRVEQETDIGSVVWRTWFECRMSATAKQPFPPFEVISKNPPVGPIATVQALPAMPTGGPADATHAVHTREPAMAKLLGETIPGWATFERGSGIHLVGDGQRVSFKMRRDKAPILANALYYAEAMSAQLAQLAVKVGG